MVKNYRHIDEKYLMRKKKIESHYQKNRIMTSYIYLNIFTDSKKNVIFDYSVSNQKLDTHNEYNYSFEISERFKNHSFRIKIPHNYIAFICCDASFKLITETNSVEVPIVPYYIEDIYKLILEKLNSIEINSSIISNS